MGFYINCPHCFGKQHLSNADENKTIKCEYCDRKIKLCNDIPEKQIERKTVNIPQLRMQALQMTKTSIGTQSVHYDFATADKFVHYFLTGEHQLLKKE